VDPFRKREIEIGYNSRIRKKVGSFSDCKYRFWLEFIDLLIELIECREFSDGNKIRIRGFILK
jgi:hypothetical protein